MHYNMAVAIGAGLIAVGEAISPVVPELGVLTNLGAVGVLAWVAVMQQKSNVEMRREMGAMRLAQNMRIEKLTGSWNTWEQVRHEDSDKLNGTLRDMVRHCAELHGRVELTKPKTP